MDERQWLLATSYNTGAECLQCGPINIVRHAPLTHTCYSASMLDEAKRWFEASTMICKFVPEGQERAEKVCPTFLHFGISLTQRADFGDLYASPFTLWAQMIQWSYAV